MAQGFADLLSTCGGRSVGEKCGATRFDSRARHGPSRACAGVAAGPRCRRRAVCRGCRGGQHEQHGSRRPGRLGTDAIAHRPLCRRPAASRRQAATCGCSSLTARRRVADRLSWCSSTATSSTPLRCRPRRPQAPSSSSRFPARSSSPASPTSLSSTCRWCRPAPRLQPVRTDRRRDSHPLPAGRRCWNDRGVSVLAARRVPRGRLLGRGHARGARRPRARRCSPPRC